jgi:hypothetical protein
LHYFTSSHGLIEHYLLCDLLRQKVTPGNPGVFVYTTTGHCGGKAPGSGMFHRFISGRKVRMLGLGYGRSPSTLVSV